MLKSNLMTLLALSCSSVLLLILWVIRFLGDELFFHSDVISQLVILSSLSILLTGCGLLLLTPILVWRGSSWMRRIRRCMERVFFVWLVGCSLWWGLQFFILRRLAHSAPRIHVWAVAEILSLVMLLIAIAILHKRTRRRDQMVQRSTAVARTVFSVALVVTLYAIGGRGLAHISAHNGHKRFILVVLDRCPYRHLRAFNPLARTRTHDSVFDRARVYTNVHTTLPYTWGYFGVLYGGTTRPSTRAHGDVLAFLRHAGVRTRIFADHRNALPEGSSLRRSKYNGIRSSLLKPFMCPFLNMLNLDYSLNYGPSYTPRTDSLLSLLPESLSSKLRGRQYANRFDGILIPEIQRLNKATEKSLLVFHTDWQTGETVLLGPESLLPTREAAYQRIRNRDYHYTPEESWYAELTGARCDAVADHLLVRMAEVLDTMASRGLLRNTIVMFTSDHGTMSDDGRLWYGYHPHEHVLRVGAAAFGDVEPGIDQRLLSTPDISQTILDYFGVKEQLDTHACSLLSSKERPITASLTLSSDIYREQFLIIYRQNMKYVFNLHPRGNGECTVERLDSPFSSTPVAKGQSVLLDVAADLLQAMSDLNITDDSTNPVHPLFTQERLRRIVRDRELSGPVRSE